MKVLHIAETIKGGVATVISSLAADQMARADCDVRFLVPADQRQYLKGVPDALLYLGSWKRSIGGMLAFWRAISAAYAKERPDIVHLHSTFAGFIFRLFVLNRYGSRTVYHPHGVSFDPGRASGMKRFFFTVIERALAWRTDRIIAISGYEKLQHDIAGFGKKCMLVENGVRETSCQVQKDHKREYFLFVGRFDQQKGIDLLLDYWQEHEKTRCLRVVGDFVVSEEGAATMQLPDVCNIEFSGWLMSDQLDEIFAGAKALLVPSRWEGFGLVMLEAYRNGTPVVCSDQGALPSLVEPGKTGFIVPLADFSRKMQEAIAALEASSPQFWQENCRQAYLSRFREESMCQGVFGIYTELLR